MLRAGRANRLSMDRFRARWRARPTKSSTRAPGFRRAPPGFDTARPPGPPGERSVPTRSRMSAGSTARQSWMSSRAEHRAHSVDFGPNAFRGGFDPARALEQRTSGRDDCVELLDGRGILDNPDCRRKRFVQQAIDFARGVDNAYEHGDGSDRQHQGDQQRDKPDQRDDAFNSHATRSVGPAGAPTRPPSAALTSARSSSAAPNPVATVDRAPLMASTWPPSGAVWSRTTARPPPIFCNVVPMLHR